MKKLLLLITLIIISNFALAEINDEFEANFIKLAPIKYKTPEEWAKFNSKPPYIANKEIIGEYNKSTAAKCVNGIFVGKDINNVVSWKGIPYAEQPVGKLRWKASIAPKPSDKVFEAYHFGKIGIQNVNAGLGSSFEMGEDCLTLNVYNNKSNPSNKKPVLFWIHGGAFAYGSSADYEGYTFVRNNPDIVFVTINYRLGIWAINNFKNLKGGKDAPLQCGFTDQIQALKWVKENITAFGGDPHNVTIIGESAGSISTSMLCVSPKAKGLFNKAVCFSASVSIHNDKEELLPLTEALCKEFNCKTFDELQKVPTEKIQEFWKKNENKYFALFPYGDEYMPYDPIKAYENGVSKDIIMLQGNTKHEMYYFAPALGSQNNFLKYCNVVMINTIGNGNEKTTADFTKYVQSLKTLGFKEEDVPFEFLNDKFMVTGVNYQIMQHTRNGGKTYAYTFEKEFDAPEYLKSAHTVDYKYLFEQYDGKTLIGTKEQIDFDVKFQQMIVNFAKFGDPSIEKIKWPLYNNETKERMIFHNDNTFEIVSKYQDDRINNSFDLFTNNDAFRVTRTLLPNMNEYVPISIVNKIYDNKK